jgi:DNA-binding transcriptional MerR regulator
LRECNRPSPTDIKGIAQEHGITLEEVRAILDEHPIEKDREKYLRRALAQQLLLLDRLEVAFSEMAFVDRGTATGAQLVKVAERRTTLLGLNPPIGHAVSVVQHPPENQPTSTDKIKAALNALLEDGRRNGSGSPH